MSSPSIEKLYEYYEVVNSNVEKDEAKKVAYQNILTGVTGDEKEKRLASQFISKFFKLFPDLYEEAFNKLLDLCEDDNVLIRKQVIQCLPMVGKSVPEYIPKIADTLTQMLVADDNTEIMVIYAALNSVMKLDFKVALEAIFHQLITQLEEANELINTCAFKYLNEKLGNDCSLQPEIETIIESSAKTLLTKLIGKEEYSLVIGILSYLKVNSTLIGRQKLVNELSEQTKLLGKIDEPQKFATLISHCKQIVKLLSKNVHADDLIIFLLENLSDMTKLTVTNANCSLYDLFKCVVDIANRGKNMDGSSQVSTLNFSSEESLKSLQGLFQVVLEQLPSLPEEISEEAITKMSEDKEKMSLQEASLLAMYCLCRSRPDAIAGSADLLKEFRPKLQFLARVNQASGKTSSEVVAKLTKAEQQSDDGKAKFHFSKVASNLQLLIREFFKVGPTFKTVIVPSWITVVPEAAPATATVAVTPSSGAPKGTVAGSKRPGPATAGNGANPGPAKTRIVANNRGGGTRRGFSSRGGRR